MLAIFLIGQMRSYNKIKIMNDDLINYDRSNINFNNRLSRSNILRFY